MMIQCSGGGTSCPDKFLGSIGFSCLGIGHVGSGGRSSSSSGELGYSMFQLNSSLGGHSFGAGPAASMGFSPIKLRY